MMGRRKAAVFPDPVGAQANISLLWELEKIVEINSQERKIKIYFLMLQIKCTLYVTRVHETSVHYSAN